MLLDIFKKVIEQTAEELIKGIEEYDAAHPDESEADESEEGGESNE